MDVMFYEVFEEEEKLLRRYLPRRIKAGFTRKTIQGKGSRRAPASLISIRTQSVIPPAWAKSLLGILTRSTGYDHLREYRIRHAPQMSCGYLPLYCARSVAEHAILVMMALLRRLKKQMKQFNRFHRDGLTGGECLGRCLLVIGVGHIGQEVVKLARGVGMFLGAGLMGAISLALISWLVYHVIDKFSWLPVIGQVTHAVGDLVKQFLEQHPAKK